jgi:hypothetical protein
MNKDKTNKIMSSTKSEYCSRAWLVSVLLEYYVGKQGCVSRLGALSLLSYDGPLPRHYLLFSYPALFFPSQPP